jgi:CPA1 family monovalent cation:H+ antiporter
VILFSLLGASIALPQLLKGLQLPADSGERKEEDLARRLSSKAALAGVERMRQQLVMNQNTENVQLYNDAASRVSLLYQRHLEKDNDGPTWTRRRCGAWNWATASCAAPASMPSARNCSG